MSPATSDMIFITANGVIGHRVAVRLLKAGYKVRIGAPDVETAQDLVKLGAEVIPFQWEDGKNNKYISVLASVKTVFFVIDPLLHEGWVTHFKDFYDACRSCKVNHIVKISFYHALVATRERTNDAFGVSTWRNNPFQHIPFVLEHADCDEKIMKNRMDYTLLFVTHKMSDPLTLQRKQLQMGELYGASGDERVNYVSPNDIAAAAVRILTDPKSFSRKGYTLTGPAIKDSHVAKLLGETMQKKVDFVNMTLDEFKAQEEKLDPDWIVEDLVPLEKLKASGLEKGFVSHDFEKICGRKYESFRSYLSSKVDMTPSELWCF
jgi:NAD(P)H dehydrogenase (quinone)